METFHLDKFRLMQKIERALQMGGNGRLQIRQSFDFHAFHFDTFIF